MGFTDNFVNCITGKTLPPELARLLPSPTTALSFAAKLVKGATVEEALLAIGVGAPVAAEVAELVADLAVAVIVAAVVACAGSAIKAESGSLGTALAQMDSSEQEALQSPLADAGFTDADTAAA